jgi:hypothetical protein
MNRPFQLPESLPAQTAMTLFELVSDLAHAIWNQYESDLVEICIAESNQPPDPQQAFDFDDGSDDDGPPF